MAQHGTSSGLKKIKTGEKLNIIKSLILLTFLVTILSQIKISEQANIGKDLVTNTRSSIK